ncbi:response regulator [Deinococcus deserti]|uniref:Putative response regulator, CheY n=1 Tax=Deinococcus deserti (strain DSM 17065 / CIP 109153 / LMG 22923 / VCD115) TaxID=546414 RepID=C1D2K7_DEIDV|nr:response regulator [Deinococcus deserti]ACO47646.1 putative response regulator, CheY [Deinococcus deserti VCD115]
MRSTPQSCCTLSPHILLIDDNPLDRELTELALLEVAPGSSLTLAESGIQAMQLLWAGLRTDLILLDVNMPGMHGFDVLQALRADTSLNHIPVVMLSTSGAERDRAQAQALEVDGYMVKASRFEAYVQQMLGLMRWYHAAAPLQTLA